MDYDIRVWLSFRIDISTQLLGSACTTLNSNFYTNWKTMCADNITGSMKTYTTMQLQKYTAFLQFAELMNFLVTCYKILHYISYKNL